jgi:hypothetical protein
MVCVPWSVEGWVGVNKGEPPSDPLAVTPPQAELPPPCKGHIAYQIEALDEMNTYVGGGRAGKVVQGVRQLVTQAGPPW